MKLKMVVRKIVSLNPTRYTYIPFDKALEKYIDWIATGNFRSKFKSFEKWLDTEI
jgi:hypothetical protein